MVTVAATRDPQLREVDPQVDIGGARPRARTARRTSSTGRRSPSTGSTSKAEEGDAGLRARAKAAGGDQGGRAEVPRHWAARDLLDPRREERPLALAAGRRQGQRHARRRSGSTARRAGATTSGRSGRSCATPTQGLYNLYVVDPSEQQILALLPGRRRQRLPGRPDRPPGDRPRRSKVDAMFIDGDIFVAEDGSIVPVRRRPGRGLADRRAARRPLLRGGPDYSLLASRERQGTGCSTATTRRTTADRRHRQGERHVQRAVPARRRRAGLGGPARDVRRARARAARRRRSSGSTASGLYVGRPGGRRPTLGAGRLAGRRPASGARSRLGHAVALAAGPSARPP